MYRTYIKRAIVGVMNEQFNLIKMHGTNNVKISKLRFKELALKFLEVYYRICSHYQTPFDYFLWGYFQEENIGHSSQEYCRIGSKY
jgi:hypothetical protein